MKWPAKSQTEQKVEVKKINRSDKKLESGENQNEKKPQAQTIEMTVSSGCELWDAQKRTTNVICITKN